jgi:hypothetical protein
MSYKSTRINMKNAFVSGGLTNAQKRKVLRNRERALARRYDAVIRRGIMLAKRYPPRYRLNRTGGFLGLELKFLDCAWNGVTINASTDGSGCEMPPDTGCTGCISVPPQGDGESSRDGKSYVIKSVWVSGTIHYTEDTGVSGFEEQTGVFFALVQDTQSNGATIASEDVYINPGTTGITMCPQPLRNLQNSKRFRILDSQYVPPPGVIGAGNDGATTFVVGPTYTPTVTLNWKGNIKVNCTTGTTANISTVSDNSIHVVAYTGTVNYTPVFYGKSRLRFMG